MRLTRRHAAVGIEDHHAESGPAMKGRSDGTAGVASSDLPVSVVDTSLNLLAQQFRLYPADSQFALLEVQGEVAFAPPPTEGAQDAAAPQTEGAPATAAPAPPQGEAPPS